MGTVVIVKNLPCLVYRAKSWVVPILSTPNILGIRFFYSAGVRERKIVKSQIKSQRLNEVSILTRIVYRKFTEILEHFREKFCSEELDRHWSFAEILEEFVPYFEFCFSGLVVVFAFDHWRLARFSHQCNVIYFRKYYCKLWHRTWSRLWLFCWILSWHFRSNCSLYLAL